MKSKKSRTILLTIFGVILVGLAILVWVLQQGNVETSADVSDGNIDTLATWQAAKYSVCSYSKVPAYNGGGDPICTTHAGSAVPQLAETATGYKTDSSGEMQTYSGVVYLQSTSISNSLTSATYLSKKIGTNDKKVSGIQVDAAKTLMANGYPQVDIYLMSAVNLSTPSTNMYDNRWIKVATVKNNGAYAMTTEVVDGVWDNFSAGPVFMRMDMGPLIIDNVRLSFTPTSSPSVAPTPTSTPTPTVTTSIGTPPVPEEEQPTAATDLSYDVTNCTTTKIHWKRGENVVTYKFQKSYPENPTNWEDLSYEVDGTIPEEVCEDVGNGITQCTSPQIDPYMHYEMGGWSEDGGTRSIRVLSIGINGQIEYSEALELITPSCYDTNTIESPTNVEAEANGNYSITVSWNKSITAGIDKYLVYMEEDSSTPAATVDASLDPVVTFSGLDCNKLYNFWVKAVRNNETSVSSNIASATTATCRNDGNDDITNLRPENISVELEGNNTIVLRWDEVDGAVGYSIYTCDGNLVATTINNYYYFYDLAYETEYCFYVVAHDGYGNSSQRSDSVRITTASNSTDTDQISSVTTLVSTGGNLWINILVALILTGGIGYFLLKDRKQEM